MNKAGKVIMIACIALFMTAGAGMLFAEESAQAAHEEVSVQKPAQVQVFGLIAAAVAFSAAAIGSGIAISHVGSAAMGAIGEKPEIAGQALIFIALAEGIVVFGFITALMILGKV